MTDTTDATAQASTDAAAAAEAATLAASTAASEAAATAAAEKAATETAKPVVPDTYDLKLPDGSTVDPAIVERTAATARALGLSNEAGQTLLETTAAELDAQNKAFLTANTPGEGAAWKARVAAYEAEAKADPVLGTTPETFAVSVEKAQQVLAKFGSPKLTAALNATGFGSHPEVLKLLAGIGRSMSEGTLVLGSTQSGGKTEKAPYEGFYDHPTSRAP